MFYGDISDLLNPKKDEIRYYILQHKLGWAVQDNMGYSAIGATREQAIENYMELLNRKIAVLTEKIERDQVAMKRRRQELWNY